ncbi:hypothetical protein V6X63_10045, partial [Spiribacter sp. 221]|uniref:hypothetical protein n=1 Tax=Spiribacter onubensis TaxID=3122420 RepID=UPI00349F3A23
RKATPAKRKDVSPIHRNNRPRSDGTPVPDRLEQVTHLTGIRIADLAYLSQVWIPARIETRPAQDVLPDSALSTSEAKLPKSPVALSKMPVVMREDEAGEMHLNRAVTHRSWIHHGESGAQKARDAAYAQRFHPLRPIYVLSIDAEALDTPTHVEVIKDYYQIIQPVAEGLPDHCWREVIAWIANHPRKRRAFAEVVFNRPAEHLTAKQIRALLSDAVSEDSVQRRLKECMPQKPSAKSQGEPPESESESEPDKLDADTALESDDSLSDCSSDAPDAADAADAKDAEDAPAWDTGQARQLALRPDESDVNDER